MPLMIRLSRRGSSPLTRGKRRGTACIVRRRRLIPAHAGKTGRLNPVRAISSAHPRSRGENRGPRSGRLPRRGSSPLTRGKRDHAADGDLVTRLIPAHAGKTSRRRRHPERSWAHPRSRGENHRAAITVWRLLGSSPLTRGKRRVHREAAPLRRLIPAHAGKTRWSEPRHPPNSAHPRSRGENVPEGGQVGAGRGSSPLTRGKRAPVLASLASEGLIPAHAGKTRAQSYRPYPCPAHPRSRGENASEWCTS